MNASTDATATVAAQLDRLTEPATVVAPVEARPGWVRCLACGHRCAIPPARRGVCRVRFNQDGTLRAPFGYVSGVAVDPVEKKPFHHVLPGSAALSFGMLGCDLHCAYCQNWFTSQSLRDPGASIRAEPATPESLVTLALQAGAPLVVSTYNEPLITLEWGLAVFTEAKRRGLITGFVSNGNATPEALDALRPVTDLYKVDLKSFSDRTYRRLGGTLGAVTRTLRGLKERGFWIEVVTLLVPGLNDSDAELGELTGFLAGLDPLLPWHVTAFHPDYRMTGRAATADEALDRAARIGATAGLRYVYAGNRPGRVGGLEDTRCHGCETVLVRRQGFRVVENRVRDARCPGCGTRIPGIWEHPRPDAT